MSYFLIAFKISISHLHVSIKICKFHLLASFKTSKSHQLAACCKELSLISWQRNQNYDFPLLRGTDQSCSLPSCRRRAKRLACRRLLPAVDASYGFHESQALSVDLE